MSIDRSYDAWAQQYDLQENKTRDLDHKATIDTLSKYSFSHVLELGCGTGKNTSWLAQKAEQVIGLDFSDGMLALAKEKIKEAKVHFIKADLNENWDIENQSLDLVSSSLTLEHVEDLHHVFAQAYQKLKQHGLFFISELHPFKQYQGSKARFETDQVLHEIQVITHHITDYIDNANKNGFTLLEINEWFDEDVENGIPRLISFVFSKNTEIGSK